MVLEKLFVYIGYFFYALPFVVIAWYLWLFFRKRKHGERLPLYPIFILLAPILFTVIWFALLLTGILNVFDYIETHLAFRQGFLGDIYAEWLPVIFILSTPLIALALLIFNIIKHRRWASIILFIAFVYSSLFAIGISNIDPISYTISSIEYYKQKLSGKLVIPKTVSLYLEANLEATADNELKITPIFRIRDKLWGSRCSAIPIITEVVHENSSILVNILGHEPSRSKLGHCAEIFIQDGWFTNTNEVAITFILNGKNNLFSLAKIKGELIELVLRPIEVMNVISYKRGYSPPSEATPLSIYLNIKEYNDKYWARANEAGDATLCDKIVMVEHVTCACKVTATAVKQNDISLCEKNRCSMDSNACKEMVKKVLDKQ